MTVYNRKYDIWRGIFTAYFALGQKSFLVVLKTHQIALCKGLTEIRVRTHPTQYISYTSINSRNYVTFHELTAHVTNL